MIYHGNFKKGGRVMDKKEFIEFFKNYIEELHDKQEDKIVYIERYDTRPLFFGKHFKIYEGHLRESYKGKRLYEHIFFCINSKDKLVWKISPEIYRTVEKGMKIVDDAIDKTLFFDDVDVSDITDNTYPKLLYSLALCVDNSGSDDLLLDICSGWLECEFYKMIDKMESEA